MKFEPAQNRVIVKLIEQKKESEGSIIIPDTVQQDPKVRFAEVVALGPRLASTYRVPEKEELLQISVGDKVYIGMYGGIELPTEKEEEKLLIITYDDILVKLKEE